MQAQESQQELFEGDRLVRRLRQLGLRGVRGIAYHENRSVMVSVTKEGVLRLHRGYAYAPDHVLSAIVAFVDPRRPRSDQGVLERRIVDFPVHGFVGPRRTGKSRRPRLTAEERHWMKELKVLHQRLNHVHFGGTLATVPIRVSRRMRRRLGEVDLDERNRPVEIAVSLRHLQRDRRQEIEHTMLHEMVHQWQAESGLPVDHGAIFRRKACEVGIAPRAMRDV